VVAVALERRVLVAVLDVAQQLGGPVRVGALGAHAVHGPYADDLGAFDDAVLQFCDRA
jgi:hypothetical protein